MKRSLILLGAVTATLASCSKSEVAAVIANKNDTPKNFKFLIFFYFKWF